MDLEKARWRKSSYSGTESACVEVACTPGIVAIRDTKNRTAGTLTIPEPTWHDLTSHFRRAAHPIMSTPTSNPEASS
ncbi:DUF397 domain-containing protein [Kibdelosporangium aridum]|uniref:DUF397 domain-containing protein n=1 Tax=Kibdelosporangium aridum TaxID=2030 RepID=A0A1W2FPE4_KIBAR|nr:DUF397 domain-containing protein [Kibdelosporangium aridum]SMD23516.1 protein of unknown function [Kibdelosporangium aridum]